MQRWRFFRYVMLALVLLRSAGSARGAGAGQESSARCGTNGGRSRNAAAFGRCSQESHGRGSPARSPATIRTAVVVPAVHQHPSPEKTVQVLRISQ